MKSEKEIIHEYATELKMPVFKDELEYILSQAAAENWNHLRFLTELLEKECTRRRECGRRKSRIRVRIYLQMKCVRQTNCGRFA